MKQNSRVAILTLLSACLAVPAIAQQTGEATYKAKCAMCHGADGKGTPTGQKMGVHDFRSAEVQNMSDDDLGNAIAKGKNKMPAYKTIKPEDVKGLVTYIRSLEKG